MVSERRPYNGFGHLVCFQKGEKEVWYRYRPDGLRHSKQIIESGENRVTTHFWDGQNIVLESSTNGSTKAKYIRGLALIAQIIGDQGFYYLHNGHGDVVQRIDNYGNPLVSYEYDAFGNQLNQSDIDPNPFRYCGEYFDVEIEEIYLRNRSYNSSAGRFSQEDPVHDGLNWYTYCGNKPIRYIDPSGLANVMICDGGSGNSQKKTIVTPTVLNGRGNTYDPGGLYSGTPRVPTSTPSGGVSSPSSMPSPTPSPSSTKPSLPFIYPETIVGGKSINMTDEELRAALGTTSPANITRNAAVIQSEPVYRKEIGSFEGGYGTYVKTYVEAEDMQSFIDNWILNHRDPMRLQEIATWLVIGIYLPQILKWKWLAGVIEWLALGYNVYQVIDEYYFTSSSDHNIEEMMQIRDSGMRMILTEYAVVRSMDAYTYYSYWYEVEPWNGK